MYLTNLASALPSARPAFLLLAPICVTLAIAIVYRETQQLDALTVLLALIGSVTAAIAVNTINEFQDFESGLDLTTKRTPFSGGSGLLTHNSNLLNAVKLLAALSLVITCAIGIYFTVTQGLAILPIGLLGLILVITYTNWINRHPILCYLAPGLGFGYFMTLGTIIVLNHSITLAHLLLLLIPCLLISNLLLVNQLPDIEQDKRVGRNHWAIKFGIDNAANLYLVSALITISVLVSLVIFEYLPLTSAIAVLPLCATFWVFCAIKSQRHAIGDKPGAMAINVVLTLATPIILSLSLLLT
ncbi:prenyltransferase [Thalassotalea sediminis]|uniref:prenyltransferase n=1 Tax=Thalassotalea sediminis TaxID=1759089 RepID=UPI00257278BF|nr:prenyltransferase [Thalassotalea sediminis]